MIVEDYGRRLFEFKQNLGVVDDAMLVQCFVRGLNDHISGDVRVSEPMPMEIYMEKA